MDNIHITSHLDMLRYLDLFRKHNHDITPNWIINMKETIIWKRKLGFKLHYSGGYFFWTKQLSYLQ